MNFFRFRGVFDDGAEEMAKARKSADQDRVAMYVGRLNAAGTDRAAFDEVLKALDGDVDAAAVDIIAIAVSFNRGGTKPGSRAKAMALIRKRHVEILRTAAKNKIAEKARPW